MTNVIQTIYPKDLTMTLASNHIEREVKQFTSAQDRIFVPDGGPFFSQSLILKDSNGRLLKPQVEYKLLYLNEEATLESGRDVVSVIWVMSETISSVLIDYRVVGGPYGNTVNAIMQEIQKAGPIKKNVDWNSNVYGKPTQFPPAPHFHTPDTFTGWNMIYEQLEGIRKAIISGDDASWESHYNYISRLIGTLEFNLNGKFTGYATLSQLNSAISGLELNVDLTNYFTKTQVTSAIQSATNATTAVADNLAVNYYTKVASDARYPLKTDSYTKAESDAKYPIKGNVYTKTESDAKYLTSVSLNGYYTTSSAVSLENRLNVKIEGILDAVPDLDLSGYYTKSQTYAKTDVYSKTQTYSNTQIDAKIAALETQVTSLTNTLNAFIPKYRIISRSGNYSVAYADLKGDTILRCTSGTASTVTLPAVGASMQIGHVFNIRQVGAGAVTITGVSGVVINPTDSLVLRRAGSTATLVYVANNTFDLISELS